MKILDEFKPENDFEQIRFHQEILKVYLSGNQIMEASEYARDKMGYSQLALTLVNFKFLTLI
jgi:hypothetical protein